MDKEFWKQFRASLPKGTKVFRLKPSIVTKLKEDKGKGDPPSWSMSDLTAKKLPKEIIPDTKEMLFIDWHVGMPWPHECSFLKRGEDGEWTNIICDEPPTNDMMEQFWEGSEDNEKNPKPDDKRGDRP